VKGLLTSSALKTYRECPKKYELMYDQRWRPVRTSAALRFGTLTHKALEAWWKNLQGDRLGAALEALRTESDPWDAVKVRELMIGYEAKWGPSAGDYEVVPGGVEMKFTLPLMNPDTMGESRTWDLGGKMDVLVQALRGPYAGCIGVVEHKTSSEDIENDASPYFLKLTLDGQISQYYLGGMALGHDVEFCVYDVLKKPTIKQLQATPADQRKYRKDTGALYANQRTADETPEEYGARLRELIVENPNRFYRRHLVMRTDAQMKEFLGEAWDQGRSIRDGQLAGRAPKNPDACFRYGMCAFWSHCSSGVELEHSPDFYQIPDPHAELKEETVQA